MEGGSLGYSGRKYMWAEEEEKVRLPVLWAFSENMKKLIEG